MARSEGDTWDLASSVGATATMVAAARAAATKRPQPVINDPFAEPLVRAVGIDLFTRVAAGELDSDADAELGIPRMTDMFAARARFYDDYFAEAGDAGMRQVVIVASGLDCRAYRLAWPDGTTVYEIDQPEVIEFKTATLSEDSAPHPTAEHRTVGIDLREDWPAALQDGGLRFRATYGLARRGRAHRISAAGGRGSVAGHRHSAVQRQGSRLSADFGIARTEGSPRSAGTGADHGRGLATARTRYGLSPA